MLTTDPWRWFLLAAAAAGLLLVAFVLSLLVGDIPIRVATVRDALCFYDSQLAEHVIVRDWRLPRAVADVLVGASLAVAGAIMQAMTRNPLASPGIMGLNTGASFATVLAMVLWPTAGRFELIVLSIAGATLGAALVYGSGFSFPKRTDARSAGPDRHCRLGALGAIGNGVMIYHDLGQDALLWFARGTEGVNGWTSECFFPWPALACWPPWPWRRRSSVLTLGEHVARGLGQRTSWTKFLAATHCVLSGRRGGVAGRTRRLRRA